MTSECLSPTTREVGVSSCVRTEPMNAPTVFLADGLG